MKSSNRKIIGVIPARYGSTRFPGKPLELINGKPLLQWVIEGVRSSRLVKEFIVATDDERISEFVQSLSFGVDVIMTGENIETGTDRVWQACQNRDFDIVLNIQGDEPLIKGELLDQLCQPFLEKEDVDMATLGRFFQTKEEIQSVNTAKIIINKNHQAIYFSRYPIPYSRENLKISSVDACLKHIGMYAYTKEFLQKFCEHPSVSIEKFEGLEQLRALYLGAKVHVVRVESDSWGVDIPEDIRKIEKLMELE